MTIEIREADDDDVEPILALWAVADATSSITDTPDDLKRIGRLENATLLVASTDAELIGSVIAAFDGWRGTVYRLAVHPAHRRQGVARALIDAADKRFRNWEVKRVSALVEKEHASAVGFWNDTRYVFDERMIRYVRTLGVEVTA